MTAMEPAPRQVAVKVSPKADRPITSGAHYLHISKKDLEAVGGVEEDD